MDILKNRKILLLVGILIGVVLLLFAATSLTKDSATKTAGKFVSLLQKGDTVGTYSLFTADQKKTLAADKWATTLKSINTAIGKNTISKDYVEVQSATSEYLYYKATVEKIPYRVYFVTKKINNKWLIDSVTISIINKKEP